MSDKACIPVHRWLIEPLSQEVEKALQRLQQSDDVQHIAVMPDIHLARDICIGTVMATEHLLYPNAVGGDIGCGMSAVQLDVEADILRDERRAARVLQALYRLIPINKHGPTARESLPETLLQEPLPTTRLEKMKHREGRVQLGTLGRGNHFFECQEDREGMLWLMVHSGSRAMGQAIRHEALQHTTASSTGLMHLDARTPEGEAYLSAMNWALTYASTSRQVMLETICEWMSKSWGVEPNQGTWIDSHHNHVQREEHQGRMLWVHRKGANHAALGKSGMIPGSMGSPSFLVEGRGEPTSLCSSSHGAGRAKSRTQARYEITPSALDKQMKGVWFDQRIRSQLVDEAPAAYKDIRAVMRAQRDLVCITQTLQPLLSFKA